ncbi:uncharacterized protein LOC114306176 [Camellia sinensis]|uniref:uncharacterized protein LOC114306176 n=1 Tax=Camellia sinensis TaxID=4442 RepID=UPI0010360474|nr:uncharacterized protein LOC114306176 [Camellia sinensis]
MTRNQFKEVFYEKYFCQFFRDFKISEFEQLKQGNMSVVEYEAKFTELPRFAPHMVDTDYKKARKFEGGLNLDVFDGVGVLKLTKYMDVLDRALMTKANLAAMKQSKALTNKWRGKRSGFNFRNRWSFSKKKNTGSSSSSSQSSRTAPTCFEYGRKHKGVYYWSTGACFRCGKTGHMIKDSPLLSQNPNHPEASLARSATKNEYYASTHSFVSPAFSRKLTRPLEPMDYLLSVSTQSGDHLDCILGMDWLTKYHAAIDCVSKSVIFQPLGLPKFVFAGNCVVPPPYLISAMKANKLLKKGYRSYLCCVLTVPTDNVNVEPIPIVKEFLDVFPMELPGDLTDREIEFTIKVVL